METISVTIGRRLRSYRRRAGLTQEELAERAELHPTYIGQAERGEKNLTIVTLQKLLDALGLSFAEFFAYLSVERREPTYAERCYELVNAHSNADQKRLFNILCEIEQLDDSR